MAPLFFILASLENLENLVSLANLANLESLELLGNPASLKNPLFQENHGFFMP